MDRPDYADAPDYADLSETDVLLYILAELQAIRYALTPPETHETAAYRCRTCNATVPPDERQTHLTEQHNAFDGIDVTEEFEQVAT